MKTLRLYLTHIGYSSHHITSSKIEKLNKNDKKWVLFFLLSRSQRERERIIATTLTSSQSCWSPYRTGQQEMNGLCAAHCGNSDVLFIVCQLIVNYFVATLSPRSSSIHIGWLVLDVVNKKNRNQIDCFQRTKTKEYRNTHSSILHIPNDYNEHPYIHMVELQFSSTLAKNDWTYWGYMGTRKTNAQLIFEAKKPAQAIINVNMPGKKVKYNTASVY